MPCLLVLAAKDVHHVASPKTPLLAVAVGCSLIFSVGPLVRVTGAFNIAPVQTVGRKAPPKNLTQKKTASLSSPNARIERRKSHIII
ncbi:hypothetical protein N658DRAFT_137626 [Parathielavia hyrcaniae]|uniref:Uncharacterized protein n=1 Tax=Parathielavia hyrcaniae TaxID=113614 RepID=A0AAN6QBV7_9PEZI|nr:hypothetical protein N658DRAFT_137626 [Parathielavia hyrcaniae]